MGKYKRLHNYIYSTPTKIFDMSIFLFMFLFFRHVKKKQEALENRFIISWSSLANVAKILSWLVLSVNQNPYIYKEYCYKTQRQELGEVWKAKDRTPRLKLSMVYYTSKNISSKLRLLCTVPCSEDSNVDDNLKLVFVGGSQPTKDKKLCSL